VTPVPVPHGLSLRTTFLAGDWIHITLKLGRWRPRSIGVKLGWRYIRLGAGRATSQSDKLLEFPLILGREGRRTWLVDAGRLAQCVGKRRESPRS